MSPTIHILAVMTAKSPWYLDRGRWVRKFKNDDTGHVFVLQGPRAGS